jgi:hypothetical protein
MLILVMEDSGQNLAEYFEQNKNINEKVNIFYKM